MHSKKRKTSRLRVLFFFIPIIVLGGVVAYGFINYALGPTTGTLHAEMRLAQYGDGTKIVAGNLQVDGKSVASPVDITIRQGSHVVAFPLVNGYWTPQSDSVDVLAGRRASAIGVYYPVKVVIAVSGLNFNVTRVNAIHGVTPVVWLNTSGQIVTIEGDSWTTASIFPGGNFTYVYRAAGTFAFGFPSIHGAVGEVDVS